MGKTTRESMKTTKLTKNRTHIIQNKRQGAEDFEGGGGVVILSCNINSGSI
jgi:hypothetical protein